MTDDNFIPYGIGAVEFRGRGWAGQFTAPGIGVAYVRDGAGVMRIFDSEPAALRAASTARDERLNQMQRERRDRATAGAKVFRVVKAGRTRLAIGAGR